MKNLIEERITIVPGVCGNRPTLELLASGMAVDQILGDYPYLEKEDIQACLEYAAQAAKHEELRLHREDALL